MSDAARRVELVDEINGCLAYIARAKERANAAGAALVAADAEHLALRRQYTTLRSEITSRAVSAADRLQKAKDVNDCLLKIEETEKALNKAKSENGTAIVEMQKLEAKLDELEMLLNKQLPTNLIVTADVF